MQKLSGGIILLNEGFGEWARPLGPEDAASIRLALASEAGLFADSPLPDAGEDRSGSDAASFICGECTSSFDVAWGLHELGLLPEWGAVLALRQTAGRGQLRRPWFSPTGNLQVSFKLPAGGIFSNNAASVLLAQLVIECFQELGLKLWLKWPNDLVLERGEIFGKLGGMLLEERAGTLLAGLGLNCKTAPPVELLREGAALPAATLPENFIWSSPFVLWLKLVRLLQIRYARLYTCDRFLPILRGAEKNLLWLGKDVLISEHSSESSEWTGQLAGLSGQGGLVLLVRKAGGGIEEREVCAGCELKPVNF